MMKNENTGLLRIRQIIGDKTTPAIIPVSRSTWCAVVKDGLFPKPIKLGKRITVWKVSDILALVNGAANHDEEGAR